MAIQQNFVTCTKLDVSLQALLLRGKLLGITYRSVSCIEVNEGSGFHGFDI